MLALDGGGVKGILTLGMLKVLEAELRRRAGNDPEFRLSDYYDLIGGTSTGSIIASGLALGMSVADLTTMYRAMGPDIFGRQTGDGVLFASKFDSAKLRKALSPVLTTKTLGTDQLKTGLAIFTKRIDTGSAWILTNNPKARYFDTLPDSVTFPNKRYRLIDLVQASAAAPTFFDEVAITMEYDGSGKTAKGKKGYFVDGAVGGHNNPSVQMLLLALVPAYGFEWQQGADRLMMTSCGTGYRRPRVDGEKFRKKSPGIRGVDALRSMIHDTVKQNIALLQAISHAQKPWQIDSEIENLDSVCITPEPVLDFQRMDIELDTKEHKRKWKSGDDFHTPLEELIGRGLKRDAMERLDALDYGKPSHLNLLAEIGERAGERFVNANYPNPKFDLPEWERVG
tara:strand:+ start:2037 stop:3227 length:1191 start_codon:yes stop_codon:yes gene_type:complete